MEIVVTNLTRMRQGYICVAGIDRQTGRHVRPVRDFGSLYPGLLARHRGPFDIGNIVDLGKTKYVGKPPELEDYQFEPKSARAIGTASPEMFWDVLQGASKPELRAVFGPDLRRQGRTYVVDVGKGNTSLGCLELSANTKIVVTWEGKVRLRLGGGDEETWLSVADLRMYRQSDGMPRGDLVASVQNRIARGTRAVACVGLSRPFQRAPNEPFLHWLQLNNIHLQDNPCLQEQALA